MEPGDINRMGGVLPLLCAGLLFVTFKMLSRVRLIKLRLSTQSLKCDFKLFPIHLTQQIELQPHINTVEMGD